MASSGEEEAKPLPNLLVPQALFVLSQPSLSELHKTTLPKFTKLIQDEEMAPYYRLCQSSLPKSNPALTLSEKEVTEIEAKNTKTLEELEEKIKTAKETEGETELADALKAKAEYLLKIGDKPLGEAALDECLEKTPGVGGKIDLALMGVRVGMFFGEHSKAEEWLNKSEKFIDEGGDWDRRNRLKVYQGLYWMSIRDFKKATPLLLSALPTFTATELLSWEDFVGFSVISGCLTLSRPDLKSKIIASPEILSVLPEVPILGDLVNSLYESRYADFFIALATLNKTHLKPSRLLSPHASFYVREMRIRAYTQILESYRTLTLTSLEQAFGVSKSFLDAELSNLIASGRLHASIDAVNGVVESVRGSGKDAQYETLIKRGDTLLNEIGRLGRVLY